MKKALEGASIVGAMRGAMLKSPFARAPAVIFNGGEYGSAARYVEGGSYVGETFDEPAWKHLIDTNEALAFQKATPAFPFASVWIFRHELKQSKEHFLKPMRKKEAIRHTEDVAGAFVAVVDERIANPFRDDWSTESFNRACLFLGKGEWDKAEREADHAWLWDRYHLPERTAILALAMIKNGKQAESDALIAALENSYRQGDQIQKWLLYYQELYVSGHVTDPVSADDKSERWINPGRGPVHVI